MSFTPDTILPDDISELTIELNNNGLPLFNVALNANDFPLPLGLQVASPSAASMICGNATNYDIEATEGAQKIGFSIDYMGDGSTCTLTISVTGSVPGVHPATIPIKKVRGTIGTGFAVTNALSASATLRVLPTMTVSQQFMPAIISARDQSLLTITLSAPDADGGDRAGGG